VHTVKKKYSTCFFFVAAAAFGDLLDFIMLLPFFVGGGLFTIKKIQRFGVTMVHAQKHLKIQRSKNKAIFHED
jgi:hypothetical protein